MEEMQKWDKALFETYGKRRFIKIDVDINKIYNKGE